MGSARSLLNLTFHGIGSPPPSVSASERTVWVSRDAFVAILDAVRPESSVQITFDDGNASDHEVALGALSERGLRATFFLLAARIGERGFLDAAQIRELARAGMTIGVHGMDHRSWRRLSPGDTERELSESRRILAAAAGSSVEEASCPFGAYDRTVLHKLRAHGYRRVYTSDRLRARDGDWFQPRYTVHAGDDASAVRSWVGQHGMTLDRVVRMAKVFYKKIRG